MRRRSRTPHPFVDDPELVDVPGGIQTCARCRLPANNQIHTMPTRTVDEQLADARRTGERR